MSVQQQSPNAQKAPWQGQSVGAGLTVVSTLAPTLGIPIPHAVRWAIFFLGVLMIGWPAVGIIRRHERLRNVDPSTIQMIGAIGIVAFGLILLGGMILQRTRTTPAPTPTVAAQIAPMPQPVSKLESPNERRYYTKAQKEELGDAMHKAAQVLSKEGMPASREARAIANGAQGNPLADNLRSLIQRANGIIASLVKVETVIWKDIFKQPADPIYDLQQLLDANHHEIPAVIQNFKKTVNDYIVGLQTMQMLLEKGSADDEIRFRVSRLADDAYAVRMRDIAEGFNDWAQQALNRIGAKQRELAE